MTCRRTAYISSRTRIGDVDGTSGRRRVARRQLRQGADGRRPLQPADHQIPQLGHARRQPRPLRRRRLSGRARPLSPLCLARLPVGAPHHHLPPSEEAGERHLDVGHVLAHGRGRLDLRHQGRLERRHGQRRADVFRKSICGPIRNTPAASPCRCCGTRSGEPSSTTNRPRSSGCSTRRSTRSDQRAHRLLSAGPAQRDRRRQRSRLSERQQRRLSRRLRHRAGGLRGSVPQRVRGARRARAPPVAAALSRRRAHDRGRLAAVPDAHSLRRGLLQPLQMQPAAHRRLSEPVELSARPLSGAGRRRDREHRSHQAALLHAASARSTRPASCRSARSSTSPRRTTATGS